MDLEKELWFLELPHQNIVELIWVLEGYEGLAVPRVLDKKRGLVELLVAPDLAADLEEILADLARQFPLRRVPRPEGVASIVESLSEEEEPEP